MFGRKNDFQPEEESQGVWCLRVGLKLSLKMKD